MKKSIKSIVLGLVTAGLLTGCFGEGTTSSSDSQVSSSNSSSNITSDSSNSSITSSSTTSSSTTSSTTSIVIKTQITLSAPKTTLEINEEVLISSNVEGAQPRNAGGDGHDYRWHCPIRSDMGRCGDQRGRQLACHGVL